MAGLSKRQWSSLLKEIFLVLRPGGWVQCTEFRGSHFWSKSGKLPKDSALEEVQLALHSLSNYKFFSYLDEMCKDMDIYWNGDHLEEIIKMAGFENITAKRVLIHVGNWTKCIPSPLCIK